MKKKKRGKIHEDLKFIMRIKAINKTFERVFIDYLNPQKGNN